MEALLSKPSLKSNLHNKDKAQYLKRIENTKRCRAAREDTIRGKRRIPDNLELTDDSVHMPPIMAKPEKKSKRASRLELLNDWKMNKQKQKIRSKKVPFVVRHIIHKDGTDKENTEQGIKGSQMAKTIHTKGIPVLKVKGLQERQLNTLNTLKNKQISDEEGFKKQSYTEWKKQQIKDRPAIKNRTSTRKQTSLLAKLDEQVNLKQNKMPQSSKPVTRSTMRVQKESTKKKTGPAPKRTNPRLADTENVIEKSETIFIENQNQTFQVDSNVANENDKMMELIETDPSVNQMEPIQSIVSKPTEFEVPIGIAFTNFKFDMKAFSPCTYKIVDNKTCNRSSPEKENKQYDLDVKTTPSFKPHLPKLDSSSKGTVRTPVALFKEKNNLTSRFSPTQPRSTKRTSLTPNPKNFLCKMEDPVAQRIESASKISAGTPPDVSESVKHFSGLVKTEEGKFAINIEKWDALLQQNVIPEQSQGNVLAAVGQAQLFMRKRFKQFKELIELHKDKSAEKAAHVSDLDGFWEMIYFQVNDVHKRFEELEKLQANNWEEDIPIKKEPEVKKVKRVATKRPVVVKKVAAKKRPDFMKFRQQMKAKKLAEEASQKVVPSNLGGFIEIMAPSVAIDDSKVITPVRRSLRNLDTISKNSPGISMVIPFETVVKSNTQLNAVAQADEFSADSLEECSPDKQVKEDMKKQDNVAECNTRSLRRSTRKTPSKYRTVDLLSAEKKPEDVACNLFATDDENSVEENEEVFGDFSKYLSKTILIQDQPVKRDLLSSFDDPVPPVPVNVELNDLMVFSPIVQETRKSSRKPSVPPSKLANDESLLH